VVLPQPFGPTKAILSPRATLKLRPAKRSNAPNDLPTFDPLTMDTWE
jgi:hypothetical protein